MGEDSYGAEGGGDALLEPYGGGEGAVPAPDADGKYNIHNAIGAQYAGEDQPGNARWAGNARSVTHYDTDPEFAAHTLNFDGGFVRQGDDEAYHDTMGAGGAHLAGSHPDRESFVMDTDGQFYSADVAAEEGARPGERYHHSSLAQGGRVAAAGEVQIRDGEVELISDRSGHYTPNLQMTGQAIDEFEDQGVPIEQVGVELAAKANQGFTDPVSASAVEVQAYRDRPEDDDTVVQQDVAGMQASPYYQGAEIPALASDEALLRYRHDQKDAALTELEQATAGRRAAADAGVPFDPNQPPAEQ